MNEQPQNKLNKYRLEDRRLYLVANPATFSSEDKFLDAVASALNGGIQIVRIEEKNANADKLIRLGKKIRELCSIYNALLIINDRVDIAKIIEADGVHLGQNDIDIKSAREISEHNTIVGISAHCEAQAIKAIEDGADYIEIGPVFESSTNDVELDYVKWAAENVNIPFFVSGGIDLDNVDMVKSLGAKRIAVSGAVLNKPSPEACAETFTKFLLE